jgi:hypothetical protein
MPTTAYRKKYYRRTEESVQIRVCNYLRKYYPGIIFFSDASGVKMSDTQRINLARMRSESGVPDLVIDHPSRGYHGLRLELKQEGTTIYKRDGELRKQPYTRRFKNGVIKRGDHLAEQASLLTKYNEMGYFARFAVGYENAVKLIDWYFERPAQQELF